MKPSVINNIAPEPCPVALLPIDGLAVMMPSGDPAHSASLSESASLDPLEDIRLRAETVSTLMREMMERGATRHWGINE